MNTALTVTFVIAEIVGVVCLTTAIIDMGMNGARWAGWAPWGLGIAAPCLFIALALSGMMS